MEKQIIYTVAISGSRFSGGKNENGCISLGCKTACYSTNEKAVELLKYYRDKELEIYNREKRDYCIFNDDDSRFTVYDDTHNGVFYIRINVQELDNHPSGELKTEKGESIC